MTTFEDKVMELIAAKRSNLSVGLDPGLPGQVEEDAVPERYLAKDRCQGLVDFCLDVVDQVADAAVTIKITQPYVMGLTEEQHRTITDRIRARGTVSIYDMKLGSILRTAFAALWHCHRWGYDAVTLTPLLGDTDATVRAARRLTPQLGTLVYVLASSPGLSRYVARAQLDSRKVPEVIVEDLGRSRPDGCLFGMGRYVSTALLKQARRTLGDRSPFVFVVGNDEKEARRILKASGPATLINVGRDIIYSDQPAKRAEEWVNRLRSFA